MNNGTFWGISDATVNFCENKYDKYTLIAEYYNTISAFCYMVVGTLTILLTRLKLLGKILCFIGVGTMLLHATFTSLGTNMRRNVVVGIKFLYY